MVMPEAPRIESRRAALHGHFTHQPGFHEVAQIVIDCSPGRTRIDAIHGFEDPRRRGVPGLLHQERHDEPGRITLLVESGVRSAFSGKLPASGAFPPLARNRRLIPAVP